MLKGNDYDQNLFMYFIALHNWKFKYILLCLFNGYFLHCSPAIKNFTFKNVSLIKRSSDVKAYHRIAHSGSVDNFQ